DARGFDYEYRWASVGDLSAPGFLDWSCARAPAPRPRGVAARRRSACVPPIRCHSGAAHLELGFSVRGAGDVRDRPAHQLAGQAHYFPVSFRATPALAGWRAGGPFRAWANGRHGDRTVSRGATVGVGT